MCIALYTCGGFCSVFQCFPQAVEVSGGDGARADLLGRSVVALEGIATIFRSTEWYSPTVPS